MRLLTGYAKDVKDIKQEQFKLFFPSYHPHIAVESVTKCNYDMAKIASHLFSPSGTIVLCFMFV